MLTRSMMCSLSYHLLKSCSSAGSASIRVMSIPLPDSGIVSSCASTRVPLAQKSTRAGTPNTALSSLYRVRGFRPAGMRFGVWRLRGIQAARLPAEHGALAGEPPVIAAQIAALAEDAMARHHERDRVLADRGADRARGARLAEHCGDLRIAARAAHRDAEQRLPHPEPETGADQHDAQRAIRPPQLRIEDPARERRGCGGVLDVARARPAAAHVVERGLLLARIGERQAGKPAAGPHDERGAERGGVEPVPDGQALDR